MSAAAMMRGIGAVLVLAASALPASAATPQAGWARWEIDAAANAPAWCCNEWQHGAARRSGCNLDERERNFSNNDDDAPTSTMIVYAKYESGKLVDARAYAPDCPVQAREPIVDLGTATTDISIDRLLPAMTSDTKRHEHLMPVLAVHAGTRAFSLLDGWAAPGGERARRKDALFWLGQVRAVEATARIRSVLGADADPAMREHAAFVLAQTRLPWREDALITAARRDGASKVRSQAWFWLAQTGSARTEAAIAAALHEESDRQVREQAIFALSQLPKPRGTQALIALIDDRALPRAERKHALFWLAQSDDQRAFDYLDQRLAQAAQ